MKKKFLISFLALCLCFVSLFGLTGCKQPLSMPNNLDVTGNGGAVVRVGDYIYFVNGYKNVSNLVSGDNRKNITQGAIYRVKASVNNNVLEYDDNGNMKGAEKIADNIAGFSSLNLFVFDDYIYFATPLALKDKQGNTQFNRTVIKRIKLNGEDSKELYTSNSSTPITWSVYKIENDVVIGVLDDTNLVSVNVSANKTNVVAQNVSSAVFPKVETYNALTKTTGATKGENQVYYTRTDDSINGNAIFVANLKTLQGNDNAVLGDADNNEYKVVSYKTKGQEGKIYYTKAEEGATCYFGTTVNSNGAVLTASNQTVQYTTLTYSDIDFTFSPYDKAIGLFTNTDGSKELQYAYEDTTVKISDTELTILAIKDNYIYGFNTENQLVKIGLDAEHKKTIIATFANKKDDSGNDIEDGKEAFYSELNTDKTNKSLFVDFDGDYMYFFRTFKNNDGTESIYLARVDYTISSETNPAEIQLVGQMEENHKYTISE